MFIASRELPIIKPGRVPPIDALVGAINNLRALYTSTVAGIKVSNPTQGVEGWSSIKENDDGNNVYAHDVPVEYEVENDDDTFERRWSSNWLTRFIAISEEWMAEVEGTEEFNTRERVIEMAAAALACVAGMSGRCLSLAILHYLQYKPLVLLIEHSLLFPEIDLISSCMTKR